MIDSNVPDEAPTLICIPDLTGFTRFMSETDLSFSKKVVPPLLRSIINSNKLNFKLGEIEGDAILFYRVGSFPSAKEIADQCKDFYINFYAELESLKNRYADDFQKIISSSRLGLKIIIHSGKISSTDIGGRVKLIGSEVITAHKLLKNNVTYDDYVLMSDNFLNEFKEGDISLSFDWGAMENGSDEYDHLGLVSYKFVNLEPLMWPEQS
jgi:hypothetical protein